MAIQELFDREGFRNPRHTGRTYRCDHCGAGKYLAKFHADIRDKRQAKVFCGNDCRDAFHNALAIIRTCLTCGKTVRRPPSQSKAKCFCSEKCRVSHGLTETKCCWPSCGNTMPYRRFVRPNGKVLHKTNLRRGGNYERYPLCESHKAYCLENIGSSFRMNGRNLWLEDPNIDMGSRCLSGKISRLMVFSQTQAKCAACDRQHLFHSKREWEIDHVVPVYKGGKTNIPNLRVLCVSCHVEKTHSEKSETAKLKKSRDPLNRWMPHVQKDELIASLRSENIDLKAQILLLRERLQPCQIHESALTSSSPAVP